MPITLSDIKTRAPKLITDTSTNGGRMTYTEIADRVSGAFFPVVSAAERDSGWTRKRKDFKHVASAADDVAYNFTRFFVVPTVGEDRILMGKGTHTDTAGDHDSAGEPFWVGTGKLNSDVTAGATSIAILLEGPSGGPPESGFLAGSRIYLSDHFLVSQTAASSPASAVPRVGDSVQYDSGSGKWSKIAVTSDMTHPKGVWLGDGDVYSVQTGHHSELVTVEDTTTVEVIGTGDDTSSPSLSALSGVVNGVEGHPEVAPTITATSGGSTLTVTVGPDGTCSGDCTAGELDLTDGTWTTQITWSGAVDSATDIEITYTDIPYTLAGNVATVSLGTGPLNDYTAAVTFCSGAIRAAELVASYSDFTVSSAGSGDYDDTGNPPTLRNDSTVEETFELDFTSGSGGTITRVSTGESLGSFAIGSVIAPVNTDTGEAFFSLASAGWSGSFASGDQVSLTTHPAALPTWFKQIGDAGCAAQSPNLFMTSFYMEL